MKNLAMLLAAFTIGAMTIEIQNLRERSDDRAESARAIEHAYHQGSDDGYNTGLSECKHHAIEEDDPAWDCKTMGNGICGPID